MQQSNIVESLIAAIVIAVAGGFLLFAFAATGTGRLGSYELSARMKHADGLRVGTDVQIAGVKIGTVQSLTLDRRHYFVTLALSIRDDIRIPANSRLSVSGGLLGSPALQISPGNGVMLAPGGVLN